MASIIIVSNLWGIRLGEWKGVSRKTFSTLLLGVCIILLSVVLGGVARIL
jgi:L-rhamnose-H+ transport protein